MKGSRFENIKENNNIKKAALGIGSSIVLLGIITGGILYNHNKQVQADQINSELAFVRKETNAMNSQKNDQKRINDLSKLEKDFKEYNKKKEQNNKVSDYYATSISSGRQYFTDRTSRRIKNNTLTKDQLKKINQKDLQSKVDALNNEKLFMKQNKGVVYSSDDIRLFNKNIDKLLKQYNEKLNEMKKKEEEKKAAEAASAAANSSSNVAQSSPNNNPASSVAAASNNNTTASNTNSQYTGNSSNTQTQNYNGSNGNGNSYSGGSTYHQTYNGGNNGGSTTYHAPSTNSNTRTETYPGTNSSNYAWEATEGSNYIHVETDTGDGGGVIFN